MRMVLIILLCLLVVALAWHALFAYDVWTHLATGRTIVENMRVPQQDPFSDTLAGKTWVDHEWLFQVVLYPLYRLGGVAALNLLRVALVAATFAVLLAALERRENHLLAPVLMLAAVMSSYTRFQMRPELVSMLFFALTLAILARASRKPDTRWLFGLPVIQLVWVNMHGLFILGPLAVLVFVVAEGLSKGLARFRVGRARVASSTRAGPGRGLLILGLMIAACFVNPYLHRGALYPVVVARQWLDASGGMRIIGELVPTLSLISLAQTWWFKMLSVLVLVSFILNFKRTAVWRVLLVGLTWPFALVAVRNTPVFAIAGALVGIMNLSEWWQANRESIVARFESARRVATARVVLQLLLAVVLCGLILNVATDRLHIRDRTGLRFGGGLSSTKFSEEAIGYVRKKGLHGPIFNNLAIGGMCMHHLSPEQKVFIDGRVELYESDFLLAYRSVMRKPERFGELVRKHGFNTVILTKGSYDGADLAVTLYRDANWQLVFMDSASWVFARNIPEHRATVQRARRVWNLATDEASMRRAGGFWYDREYFNQLHGPYHHLRSILGFLPAEQVEPESDLIDIDWFGRLGYLDLAEARLEGLSRFCQDSPGYHFTQAVICQRQLYRLMTEEVSKPSGPEREAALKRMEDYTTRTEEAYDRAARLQPNFPGLYYSMATFYANIGREKRARTSLKQAVRREYHSKGFLKQVATFARDRLGDAAWAMELDRQAERRRR